MSDAEIMQQIALWIANGHEDAVVTAVLGSKTDVEGLTLADNVMNVANSESFTTVEALQTIVYRYLSGDDNNSASWSATPDVDFSNYVVLGDTIPKSAAAVA